MSPEARQRLQQHNRDVRIYQMGHFDSTNGDYKPPKRTFGIPFEEAARNLQANADKLPGVRVSSVAEFERLFGPRPGLDPLDGADTLPPRTFRERVADRLRGLADRIER